jgi:replication factor C small subunit
MKGYVNQIWAEKYRPAEFKDIIGLSDNLKVDIENNLPHLLLIGPPGIGKTTLGKAIIKKFDADNLIMNSSDERGIDTIREKVKDFAVLRSSNDAPRIIMLDEADGLTKQAQESLKKIFEDNSKTCRFILTANNPAKIHDAIASRCRDYNFLEHIEKDAITHRLIDICGHEQITPDECVINDIVDNFAPDIRACVKMLQSSAVSGKLNKVGFSGEYVDKVIEFIINNQFEDMRQFMLDNSVDPEMCLVEIFRKIMKQGDISDSKKKQIAIETAKYDFRMTFSRDRSSHKQNDFQRASPTSVSS